MKKKSTKDSGTKGIAEELHSKATAKASDLVKRVLAVGVGAAFMTEESLRNLLGEIKLPKELLASLFESGNKARKEFFETISREVLEKVQSRIDPKAYLDEVIKNNEIEVQMRVKFVPKKK